MDMSVYFLVELIQYIYIYIYVQQAWEKCGQVCINYKHWLSNRISSQLSISGDCYCWVPTWQPWTLVINLQYGNIQQDFFFKSPGGKVSYIISPVKWIWEQFVSKTDNYFAWEFAFLGLSDIILADTKICFLQNDLFTIMI